MGYKTVSSSQAKPTTDEDWRMFIEKVQDANREFAKGAMEGTRMVWSHSDDVTLFGGYGGLVEPGWQNVESRLSWAAKQFSDYTYTSKLIKGVVNGDFAYLLQTEQYVFPGKPAMDLRVTMICRRESDGWKIVHRHGDIIKPTQAPELPNNTR